MALTDFAIIRRSLVSRMFSTVVTVLSVAVAVGLMLILLSMKDSGQRAFERGSGNMHLLVSADNSPLTSVLNGIFYANPPARPITWVRYQQIAADPRIVGDPTDAAWDPGFAIPIQQGDSFHGFPTLATTPDFFSRFSPLRDRPWSPADGRVFEEDWEVVLGASVARETGLAIGSKIFLNHGRSDAARRKQRDGSLPGAQSFEDGTEVHTEFPFTVVGVMEPSGSSHDRAVFLNLQSTWIIHASERLAEDEADGEAYDHTHHHHERAEAADLVDADRKITGIYLRCITRAGSDASAVMPMVASELRADTSLTVADPASEIRKLFGIVGSVNQILLGMAAVVMVSSGIGIMLALYNSMEQRRRQIAVLRVLGCSRARVFGLILTESAVLGVFGAAAGVGLGLVGSWVLAGALKDRLGLVVLPVFSAEWVLAVGAGTVLLASLAGIVPAVMAYRTGVAKNLRPAG